MHLITRTKRLLTLLPGGILLLSLGFARAETPAPAAPRVEREAIPALVNPASRSNLRATLDLNGEWDFATDPKLVGETAGWYQLGKQLPSPRKITVPGCWEAQGVGEPGLSHPNGNKLAYEPVNIKLRSAYTGAAWYRSASPCHRRGRANKSGSNSAASIARDGSG